MCAAYQSLVRLMPLATQVIDDSDPSMETDPVPINPYRFCCRQSHGIMNGPDQMPRRADFAASSSAS